MINRMDCDEKKATGAYGQTYYQTADGITDFQKQYCGQAV